MPSSYIHQINRLVPQMIELQPESIYEIGIGYGKYGFLMREYLDDYERRVWIEGCEIWEPYLQKSGCAQAYDHVCIGDWLTLTPTREHYDLILMIDVLEHFTRPNAVFALRKALKYSPTVLLATPINFPQGELNGNVHERHLSEWSPRSLADYGFNFQDVGSDQLSVTGLVTREP